MTKNNNKKGARTNNNAKGNLNAQLRNVVKEQKVAERKEQREEDYKILEMCCNALDNKISEVLLLKSNATGRYLTQEELTFCNIGIKDIVEHFKACGLEYTASTRVSTLVGVLIDLARCQVNPKLEPYHIAIRKLYFLDKFQAYFSAEYNQMRNSLNRTYSELFYTGEIDRFGFGDNKSNQNWFIFSNENDIDVKSVHLESEVTPLEG